MTIYPQIHVLLGIQTRNDVDFEIDMYLECTFTTLHGATKSKQHPSTIQLIHVHVVLFMVPQRVSNALFTVPQRERQVGALFMVTQRLESTSY